MYTDGIYATRQQDYMQWAIAKVPGIQCITSLAYSSYIAEDMIADKLDTLRASIKASTTNTHSNNTSSIDTNDDDSWSIIVSITFWMVMGSSTIITLLVIVVVLLYIRVRGLSNSMRHIDAVAMELIHKG